MYGFRKSSDWLLGAALLLLSACGGGDDFVYNVPICYNQGYLAPGNDKNSATALLEVTQTDGGVHYNSVSGPTFIIGTMPSAAGCSSIYFYSSSLRVPPGAYELKATMVPDRGKPGLVSESFPVEFEPHATYRLTRIWLEPLEAPPENWAEKTVPFPLVLRKHTLPGDSGFFEVAVAGPHAWDVGLTEGQIRKALEFMQAGRYTQDQLQAMHAAWLAENEQIIAGAKLIATKGFAYEGRYVLTRGNSCAEDMPLSRERFMEITAHTEDGVSGYFVSFAQFAYDDATATSTFNPIGMDGSFQTVITDTRPATGSGTYQGPVQFTHWMTLKPHGTKHLMITDWARKKEAVPGTSDHYFPSDTHYMRLYRTTGENGGKDSYFDYVGNDGYCLKRVGGVSG